MVTQHVPKGSWDLSSFLAGLHAEVAEAEAGQVGAHDGLGRAEELHHQLCRAGEAAGRKIL